MKCDLCKHEKALAEHLLCASCSEMVQRLLVVEERIHDLETAEEVRVANITAVAAGSPK